MPDPAAQIKSCQLSAACGTRGVSPPAPSPGELQPTGRLRRPMIMTLARITASAFSLVGGLIVALTVTLMLAGCRPGAVGVAAPVDQGVPVVWKKTMNSTEFQKLPATLVTRNGQDVGRAAFLLHFRNEGLRNDLTEAIESAPKDALIYAGFLDSNCSPSTNVQSIVNNGTVSFLPSAGGDQGECYVQYTSYAVVAIAPASVATSTH